MKEFLSTQDVAGRLGISRQHVVKQMKAGLLPFVKRGRFLRVPQGAWETWLAEQAQAALDSIAPERAERQAHEQ